MDGILKMPTCPLKRARNANYPGIVATPAKHPDSHTVVRFLAMPGCNQCTCVVCHFGGNLLLAGVSGASCSDLL